MPQAAKEQPFATLRNGHRIPLLGFGTWAKGGAVSSGNTRDAVKYAIASGYRCAQYIMAHSTWAALAAYDVNRHFRLSPPSDSRAQSRGHVHLP